MLPAILQCQSALFYFFGGGIIHIPNNYISPSTCITLGAAMLPVWKRASDKAKEELTRKKMPLLGIGAAFSFLIMMFNLPLPGGTTGHAVGAALVAILLGPYSAVLCITVALAIQALFFGDGGLLTFGANAFNMAFVMPFSAYYIYRLIRMKGNEKLDYAAAFLAGYISLNIAAFFTAVELGIQPILFRGSNGLPLYNPYPLNIALTAMMIPHLLIIGFVEGIVTAGVYAYVKRLAPEVVYDASEFKIKPLYILIGIMAVLSPIGLLAKGAAWGEWGKDQLKGTLGYIPQGIDKGFGFKSIMEGYSIAGLPRIWSYAVSAAAGLIIIFIVIKLVKIIADRTSR